jgi:glucose/arabinose dehydrogenase
MKKNLVILSFILCIPTAFAQYGFQPAFTGILSFSSPTDMEFIPDGSNRSVVLEQRGMMWILEDSQGVTTQRLFFNGKKVVTQSGCETGLLGCAFHPDYANNHFVYLSLDSGSDPNWYSQIVRYQVSSTNPDSIIPSSAFTIFSFAQDGLCNHKGGCLRFGPDGYLYASFGDGGGGGDPFKHGQDRSVFFGKILRLDVDHEADGNHYAIPADNPFASNTQGFKKEIFAYGLRNTWKFSFDKATGKLWAGDVGQDAYEEVDIITNGGNYGWNVMEGYHCYPNGDFNCDSTGMIPPIWEYAHNGNSQAITGGFVYHGSAMPSLIGKYIYGDYISGIWALSYDGSAPATNQSLFGGGGISSFAEDSQGEIYAVIYSGGSIEKLISTDVVKNTSSTSPAKLTADRTLLDSKHPWANIHYQLPQNQHVSLILIDEAGHEMEHLLDANSLNGEYQFNANSLSNGIYFLQLKGNFETASLKIIIQR